MESAEEVKNQKMHYLVATCIIVRNGKYLIAKRASYEPAFPNKWTVPGGKLESKEFTSRKNDAGNLWYNVLEELVEREVMEEVGLEIMDIGYVTSLSYIRDDGVPTIIVSLYANYKSGEIRLCKALTEYAWVTLEEAKKYDLIEGIHDELTMLEMHLKGQKLGKWKRH